MNPAMVIARREVRAYFNSPVAYIVVAAFTIIAGGIFFIFKFFYFFCQVSILFRKFGDFSFGFSFGIDDRIVGWFM